MLNKMKPQPANCAIPFLIAALAFGGCSKGDDPIGTIQSQEAVNPAFVADAELMKVSMSAALLEVALRSGRYSQCRLAKSPTPTKTSSGTFDENKSIEEALKNQRRCEIFKLAEEESASTFHDIKTLRRLPDKQFVLSTVEFRIWDGEEKMLGDKQFGLFSSRESCERIRGIAYSHFSPPWRCKDWMGLESRFP